MRQALKKKFVFSSVMKMAELYGGLTLNEADRASHGWYAAREAKVGNGESSFRSKNARRLIIPLVA